MVGIQVPVGPVPVAVAVTVDGSTTVPAATIPATTPTTAISAASYGSFAARRGTVLRYREGTSTRQQYCSHHDAFEDGHVAFSNETPHSPDRSKENADGNWAFR
jgi:hypothetical protein